MRRNCKATELKFQAKYNDYGKIQVCLYDEQTGLYLQTVGLFADSFAFNKWTRDNNIYPHMVVWGDSERDKILAALPKFGISQA